MYEDFHALQAAPDQVLHVWIEPWAEGVVVPAGSALELRACSPTIGRLEINDLEGRTVVYGWPGSTLKLSLNGEMEREFSIPVPPVPTGMDTKQFVEFMFGTPPKPTLTQERATHSRRWWQIWK